MSNNEDMLWYHQYKIAVGEAPFNWPVFGKNLLATLGFFGSVAALMLHFNMSRIEAEQAVNKQPQQVEQSLQAMPPQVIQQAIQMAQQQPQQQLQPQVTQEIQQSQQSAQPTSFSLINPGTVKAQIEQHEGKVATAYKDSMGVLTIGVGFNLERDDARQLISQIGADYDKVLSQEQSLTDAQIDQLFNITLNEALQIAQKYIPNLGSHPTQAQKVIVDMAYNLGPNKLSQFNTLKQSIVYHNYNAAADAMTKSRWYQQVGRRGPALVNLMRQAAFEWVRQQPSPTSSPQS